MMNLPDQLLNIDDHDLFDTPRLIESWTEYFNYDAMEDKSICSICDKKLSGRFKGNQKTHLMSHHPQEAAAMNCTIKRKSTASSFEVPLPDPKKSRLSNGRLGYNESSDDDCSDLELVEEVNDIPDDWEKFFVYNQETDKTKCNLCKVGKPLNGNNKEKKQRHLMMCHPKILSDGDTSAFALHLNGLDDREETTNGGGSSIRPEPLDSDSESSKRRSVKKAEEWEKYFIYDAVTNTTRCTLCSADKNPKKGNYRGNNKKHLMVIHRDVAMALNLMPEVVPMNGSDLSSMSHPMVPFEQEMVCFDGDNAGHPNVGSQKAMLEMQAGKVLADPEVCINS